MFSSLFFSILFLIFYILEHLLHIQNQVNKDLPYIRTTKGEEINSHLEGLRLFLRDYSNLNEKDVKNIEVWEHYLIYSILFNQNKKTLKELKELTKNVQII